MPASRSAIGSAAAVAVVLVIIVVGAGVYFLAGPNLTIGGSTASTTSSTTSPATSGTGSTTHETTSYTSSGSSQSQSTTTESTACSSTTSSSASSFSGALNFTSTFAAYSAMTAHLNGTFDGNTTDVTSSYAVLSAGTTTFKVNITLASKGTTVDYTAWVLRNGTALAVYYAGSNYTGFEAYGFYLGGMSAFLIEAEFSTPQLLPEFTNPAFVSAGSASTVTLGNTQVMVTDYNAKSLPLTIDQCGVTTDFTSFFVQTGTVSGVSGTLLTSMQIVGSFSGGGTTQNVDFGFGITSLTKA